MKLTREGVYLGIIIILIALCGQFYYSFKWKPARERDIHVYYNHDVEANQKVIDTIQAADKFVYFAVYTFTREDIKDALLAAKYRGLDVQGLTDKDQYANLPAQRKIIDELRKYGIPISVQYHSGIMHMKTVVTDNGYVSGSYNWTAAATKINDEVIEVGKDDTIRKQYQTVLQEVLQKYNK